MLSDENCKQSRTISILPKQEADGSYSVYLTITGLTKGESLMLADMLAEMHCGKEIKPC